MKMNIAPKREKRAYRQGVRALAAEETAEHILDAFQRRFQTDWFDQITLEALARDADVAVPTILRHFGSKNGVLEAAWARLGEGLRARRAVKLGDAQGAVRVIVSEYEDIGDFVMRALAQEQRFPALKPGNDMGRASHREWVEETFAPFLEGLSAAERRRRVDGLVMAMDLYVWQVVRRDMGRSKQHVEKIMLDLIGGVLGQTFLGARGKDNDHG